ncbi:hypothetical protein Hanom_Chr14g01290771 [Helianthus anomalus]
MSWFNFNKKFGESSGKNTSTFIPKSSEGSVVSNSYDGRGNDDHAEEVVSAFVPIIMNRCCQTSTSLSCLAMIMVIIMKLVTMPCRDKKNMAITFFVSGVLGVQQDVGGPSYAQESLGDEQPDYPEVS